MFRYVWHSVTKVCSFWIKIRLGSARSRSGSALSLFGLAQVLGLFGLFQGWSLVYLGWLCVGLGSVWSSPGHGFFSLIRSRSWVCLVWPRPVFCQFRLAHCWPRVTKVHLIRHIPQLALFGLNLPFRNPSPSCLYPFCADELILSTKANNLASKCVFSNRKAKTTLLLV